MLVRVQTAIRELEAVQELLEGWLQKLQAGPRGEPLYDGIGNVVSDATIPNVPVNVLVEECIGEKMSQSFAAELILIAHKLEGLAST